MRRICVILVSLIVSGLYAQTPQFSQFYANQVYLNPAFTGNTDVHRLAFNYRNQWAGVPKAFNSFSLAYDYNMGYNLGIGMIAVHDQAGSGGLAYTSISPLVSYSYMIKENLSVSAGISWGLAIRSTNANNYVFGDQFVTGGATTADIQQRKTFGDFKAGILVYGSNYWGGLTGDHLNRPNESLVFGQESRIPTQWTLHGGYRFDLEESEKGDPEKTLTAAFNYKFSGKFDQMDIGAYYQRKTLILGMWYRGMPLIKQNQDGTSNKDALVLLIGLKSEAMRVNYSYDITVSGLSITDTYGSHEISVVYEWPTRVRKKKKRKRNFIIPCPKF
ncbi:MAG: PorP/SprF family type IX secretion system membrane protein [Vicingaceae bacterium]